MKASTPQQSTSRWTTLIAPVKILFALHNLEKKQNTLTQVSTNPTFVQNYQIYVHIYIFISTALTSVPNSPIPGSDNSDVGSGSSDPDDLGSGALGIYIDISIIVLTLLCTAGFN